MAWFFTQLLDAARLASTRPFSQINSSLARICMLQTSRCKHVVVINKLWRCGHAGRIGCGHLSFQVVIRIRHGLLYKVSCAHVYQHVIGCCELPLDIERCRDWHHDSSAYVLLGDGPDASTNRVTFTPTPYSPAWALVIAEGVWQVDWIEIHLL